MNEPTEIPALAAILGEFVSAFQDLNSEGPVDLGERYPVKRTGEREPISPQLRRLVWIRDDGRCQGCGRTPKLLELDHVIPWSAGGSDKFTNLRCLCQPCNTDRSNFRTVEMAPLMAVTPICDRCILRYEAAEDYCTPHRVLTHPGARQYEAFCGSCKRRSTVSDPGRLL
jgi:hypothetical protein